MPRLQHAEQALTLLTHSSRSQYICHACRAHATRQIHTTRLLNAEVGFFKRMRESIFGSKDTREAARKREAKAEERAKEDAARLTVQTKKGRKGKVYQVAAVVDGSTHPEYVQAMTWDGLRRIGSEQWIKEQLDEGEKYVGFLPGKRAKLNNVQWQKLIHHVAVEILALQKTQRNLNEACRPRKDDKGLEPIRTAQITQDGATGTLSVKFDTDNAEQSLLSSIPQASAESETEVGWDALQILRGVVDQPIPSELLKETSWMSVQIKDPLVKLAITKRILQLTGHRISDPALSNAITLTDLYNILITPEPPKKLAQTAELQMLKQVAPNVSVYDKRRTPIHKEKAIGRWKIIQEELIARDLPVTGTRWRDAKPRLVAGRAAK